MLMDERSVRKKLNKKVWREEIIEGERKYLDVKSVLKR